MSVEMNDFMKISDFFYKTLGMFAYRDPKRKISRKTTIIMNLVFYGNFINLNIAVWAEIVYLVKAIGQFSSFLQATALAPCIGFCLLSEFKLLYSWINSEKLVSLVDGLQNLFPKDEKSQEMYNVKEYLRNNLRLGFFYSLVLSLTIWAFNLVPLIWSLAEYTFSSDMDKEFQWRLAYITWYPFEINTVPVYAGVYITHIFAGCTAAGGYFSCDIFMFNLIVLICMNFKYIEENLGKKSKNVKDIIKHHQIILE